MTLGAQFLKAVLNRGASMALRDVDESLFLESDQNEIGLYRFMRIHTAQYGQLPTADAIAQAGFTLPLRAGDDIQYYIDQLRERRKFNLVSNAHNEWFDHLKNKRMTDVREGLRTMLHQLDTVQSPNQYSDMAREVAAVYADYQDYKWSPDLLRGVTSGWPTCDAKTMGFQGGDLIVIVGRPGMGKSYILQESAFWANLSGKSSMIMSMEMSVKQLGLRWLARKSGVNPMYIRQGQVSTWSEGRMREAIQDIQHRCPPVYLESGDMDKSIDGVEDMFLRHTPDIIYLDSAYLFSPSGKKQGYISRWEAITSVINDLKKLALRLNRAIVITVQFNRNVKSSGYKEMDMSDIGDSDAIPRNASVILGVRKHKPPYQDTKRYIQMMKNRDGDVSDFATLFQFAPVCFEECPITEDEDDDEEEESNVTRRRGAGPDLSHMR
jgi:replicative DNA helicase